MVVAADCHSVSVMDIAGSIPVRTAKIISGSISEVDYAVWNGEAASSNLAFPTS